ncbi:MAG TPA: helix-turn-helix transcriptional regulator [Gemmatimonadaceae bacterium]|nr:helix-turn-helix transcriptional regulator [Gemmatimonadaceae bacterium]
MTSQVMVSPFGVLLREWRAARHISQLHLALSANVSSRHLSCVETGRAQPSPELIERLAEALDIPFRERNALLIAAGHAPGYRETDFHAPEMAKARGAIELILKHQEPYPAIVMSRQWDLLMVNQGAARVFGWIRGGPSAERNVIRQAFDPRGLRPYIVNWSEVAADMVRQLQSDVAAAPHDPRPRALLNEVLASPDLPAHGWADAPANPLWHAHYRKDGRDVRFFWTITTFGTAQDVTLQELRIECSFPADEATAEWCQSLAREASPALVR